MDTAHARRRPADRTDRERRHAPRLPAGLRVYAFGDLHGRRDLLQTAFDAVDAHMGSQPTERAIEIYLGDLIDRGPDSRGVVEALIQRALQREVYPLLGNHEDLMLDARRDPLAAAEWLRMGGRETLASYGAPLLPRDPLPDVAGLIEQYVPAAHLGFLSTLPLQHIAGDYFFVHAGVHPETSLAGQNRRDLLWIREPFLSSDRDFGAVVVHGHTPSVRPIIRHNRIGIDTGAFTTGNLTCLVLEDDRQLVLPISGQH